MTWNDIIFAVVIIGCFVTTGIILAAHFELRSGNRNTTLLWMSGIICLLSAVTLGYTTARAVVFIISNLLIGVTRVLLPSRGVVGVAEHPDVLPSSLQEASERYKHLLGPLMVDRTTMTVDSQPIRPPIAAPWMLLTGAAGWALMAGSATCFALGAIHDFRAAQHLDADDGLAVAADAAAVFGAVILAAALVVGLWRLSGRAKPEPVRLSDQIREMREYMALLHHSVGRDIVRSH
jgi:hypothetical protein